MIATTSYLYSKFDKFNEMFFDNELPPIKILVNRTKNTMGTFRYAIRREGRRVVEETPKHITISKYYDVTEKELNETLIHEMIHYYICYKKISDNNAHGYQFQKLAKQISDSSEYNITITFDNKSVKPSRSWDKTYYYITFKYHGGEYWSRVSKNLADKCLSGQFKNRYLADCEVYQTTDIMLDNFVMGVKKLRMFPMSKLPNVKSVRVR